MLARPGCIAILETMWGWCGLERDRTRWFTINENNHTGKRLYWFLGHSNLVVTNACPQTVGSANDHGTPCPKWLGENLRSLHAMKVPDLILVCGKVARQTFDLMDSLQTSARIVVIPHPAARMWTREALDETQIVIQKQTDDVEVRFDGIGGIDIEPLEF